MVKLVALYKQPADVAAFEEHYMQVHSPLMAQVPGVVKSRVTRFFGSPAGAPPYYLMFEAYFADRAAFDAAMKSPENRAAGKDLMTFARDLVTIAFGEEPGDEA